ncbi:8-dihydropterin diphosphate (DHPt-PP) to form 7 [Vibrio sp. B1FLJ16]|uniref:dihydropteroate synthase n=1 Tax=Vibrio sp. B1FLJ16 TaxID=2751178 RepID=UPI0015F3A038|nr:dihydropteroate synthase [Vibrio sp. B1FLJ16]CAD7810472.1 8-dihydropterin diphosphate (DHPt-PP) to form 7 [Vibrio sp. B1FLJ16]CAE6912416.1 8-dihydropterin diphosphate (DHPt-PP) to form 7 [Vibrio sp. B1FLJ16]
MIIKANNKSLDLSRPHVMAILNVTPDSFSDGGKYHSIDLAMAQVEKMIAAGVSIIDVGGESTRPGAPEVSLEEELKRVIPVVQAIREKYDVWISVDTSKAEVMRQSVAAGADLINDIRSLTEPSALEVAAEANVPVCIMHMKGQPKTMQQNPQYNDLLQEVEEFLIERISACELAGIARENIILDPGFGFGKTVEHNYHMLANLEKFHKYGLPVLAGLSRKSMIFRVLDKPAAECTNASVVCATVAAMKGAQIIRVHDFEETLEAMKLVEMTLNNI